MSANAFLRRTRLFLGGQLWVANALAGALLCGEYLDGVRPGTFLAHAFLQLGRLSCAASLSLLPGLVLLGAGALIRGRRTLAALSSAVWALYLLALFADTQIYGIFRYHFNGLVWNVLTTSGADEAVHLSSRELGLVGAGFAATLVAECALFLVLERAQRRRAGPASPLVRPGVAWSCVLVPSMVAVAGLYAWSDLARDPQVMAFARVFPYYPRVTVKRFAVRYLGFELAERPAVRIPAEGILLDYPRRAPGLPQGGPRPNILIAVVDGLRSDMLSGEVMPRTSALAGRGRVFRDHLSSGNATRFGLFGLLYGLHGSYWHSVRDEARSPVLMDALLALGYDLCALTSASWDFPEFRSTLWVRSEIEAEDRLPAERPGGRDDGVARRFEEWLAARAERAAPFFAFLLLDAPHANYSFPAECARFRPYAEQVEYLELSGGNASADRELLFNRYRNAVHYDDGILGQVLDALAQRGLLEDTLVAVTGDHGEEFFENGSWGHTSNFTRAQSQVALVLAGPGIPPGEETRPTSHVDLAPTLLELLGLGPEDRADWTLGANLLDPPAERTRVVAGWDTLGLHTPSGILVVPLASYRGAVEVYDERWQPVLDDSAILAREGRSLASLAADCRRFLR